MNEGLVTVRVSKSDRSHLYLSDFDAGCRSLLSQKQILFKSFCEEASYTAVCPSWASVEDSLSGGLL